METGTVRFPANIDRLPLGGEYRKDIGLQRAGPDYRCIILLFFRGVNDGAPCFYGNLRKTAR